MNINEVALKRLEKNKSVVVFRRDDRKVIIPALNTLGLSEDKKNFPLVKLIVFEDGRLTFQFSGDISSEDIQVSSFLLALKEKLQTLYYLLDD